MRRVLFLLPALLFATAAYTPTTVQVQENHTVYIIPYLTPAVTVSEDDFVELGARWGACTRGLAQSWINNGNVYFELDGMPVLGQTEDPRDYWERPEPNPFTSPDRCIPHTDTIWTVYWRFPLGELEPGIHEGYMLYWADHPTVDGGDYDGDGRIDHFAGVLKEVEFTIVVE